MDRWWSWNGTYLWFKINNVILIFFARKWVNISISRKDEDKNIVRISCRQCRSFQGRRYHLTWGLPDQAECPGEQDRISIIADADCHIIHGHFNRMWIVKVRLVHLRCYMLFRKVIRNNVNGNHVLLWTRDLTMTIIRCWDLIRCCFPAAADPVIKSAYSDIVFTASVSICHAALAAFIDKPDLFRQRNTGFACSCHNLSSVIVVK